MKVENLEKAYELRWDLNKINQRIHTVEIAKYVEMNGGEGDRNTTSTEKMKCDTETLLESIRLLFLSSLNKEKQDILNQIEQLD